MNRFVKKVLIFITIILGIVAILFITGFCMLLYSMRNNALKAEEDYAKQCIVCDSIEVIEKQQIVEFYDFEQKNIEQIRFYLLRNGSIINDTIVDNISKREDIPFLNFNKTDTIVIRTLDNGYFFLTNYTYQPYLCYGMFGYVGIAQCRLSDQITVNGNLQGCTIRPQEAIYSDSLSVRFK